MKYLIFTDLHGDYNKAVELIDVFKNQKCDKILFLGDLLYHGPRNDLPSGYAPKKVIGLLTPYLDKMILIKGNCDAEVDSMVLKNKRFYKNYSFKYMGKDILLTHGHHLSRYDVDEKLKKDTIVIYGHYHVFDISVINNVTYVNIGSMSIPKDNTPGYAILDENGIMMYNEQNKLIDQLEF